MNNNNNDVSGNLYNKSLNAEKKEFKPIKKIIMTASALLSITIFFTGCSNILNRNKIENPQQIEVSVDDEYKIYDYQTVKNHMSNLFNILSNKFKMRGIDIYDNLSIEDYEKVKDLIDNTDIITYYSMTGYSKEETEELIKALGYSGMEDYFEQNGYENENDWNNKSYQEIYDRIIGQTPPQAKVK